MARDIVDNPDQNRFELIEAGCVVGVVDYRISGNVVTIPHVEVSVSLRGQGVSGPFLSVVLDTIRGRDQLVRPLCSYARGYMEAKPVYHDLIVR